MADLISVVMINKMTFYPPFFSIKRFMSLNEIGRICAHNVRDEYKENIDLINETCHLTT